METTLTLLLRKMVLSPAFLTKKNYVDFIKIITIILLQFHDADQFKKIACY